MVWFLIDARALCVMMSGCVISSISLTLSDPVLGDAGLSLMVGTFKHEQSD